MLEVETPITAPQLRIGRIPVDRIEILRARGSSDAMLAGVEAALGAPLPREPNRAVARRPRLLWLAPQDWMIVNGTADWSRTLMADQASLAHVVDVTEGRVVFEVSGAYGRALLAKGTSIDLHPRVFVPDRCAQTLFAQTRILIDKVSDDPVYHLYADRSYAHHLTAWFEDAIKEFTI
jgi:sarcosine oxidase subunit gamma